MKLTDKILLFQEKLDLTNELLAEKLEIPLSDFLSIKEESIEPNLGVLKKLAEIFDISLNNLIDDNYEIVKKDDLVIKTTYTMDFIFKVIINALLLRIILFIIPAGLLFLLLGVFELLEEFTSFGFFLVIFGGLLVLVFPPSFYFMFKKQCKKRIEIQGIVVLNYVANNDSLVVYQKSHVIDATQSLPFSKIKKVVCSKTYIYLFVEKEVVGVNVLENSRENILSFIENLKEKTQKVIVKGNFIGNKDYEVINISVD